MKKIQKYVELKSIRQARKDEKICFSYPSPMKNIDGYKGDDKIKDAIAEHKAGNCKMLVWREVEVPDDYMEMRMKGLLL